MSNQRNASRPDHYDSDEFENLSDSNADGPHEYPSSTSTAIYEEVQDHEWPEYYDEIDGRLYHRDISAPYPLPVDGPELNVSYMLSSAAC